MHIPGQYVFSTQGEETFSQRPNGGPQHTGTSPWGHPTMLAASFPIPILKIYIFLADFVTNTDANQQGFSYHDPSFASIKQI